MELDDDLPGLATDRQLREWSVDPRSLRRGYRSPDGDETGCFGLDREDEL